MNKYKTRYIHEQRVVQSVILMAESMTEASAEISEMCGVENILSISLEERGRENLGYNISYIDMRGVKREWLSKAGELRKAVEDFYLDECPAHITSVTEVQHES